MERKLELDERDRSCPVARVPGWRVSGDAWKGVAVFALFAVLFGIVAYASLRTLLVEPLGDPITWITPIAMVNGFTFLIVAILYIRLIQPFYVSKEVIIDKRAGKVMGLVYVFPAIKVLAMARDIGTVAQIGMGKFVLPGKRSTTDAPCLAIIFKDNRNWRICIEPGSGPSSDNNPLSRDEFKNLEQFLVRHLLPQEPASKGDKGKRKRKT
ncbi:MAG: hypothetical protein JW839_03890 [Candidatus Lokiarchaeota archaeon]|nr:hypothetical protein [Candidatus Lokiarchaeota archaeon]